MIAAFEALRDAFRTFGMDVINMVLVCASILFCVAEKNKMEEGVVKLVRYGLLLFVLIANPFGYHIIQSFWMQDYWKIFMVLLPVIFVAIFMTELISGAKKTINKVVMLVCCVGIAACSAFFNFDVNQIGDIAEGYQEESEIAAVDEVIRASEIIPKNTIAPRAVCARIREMNPSVDLLYGEALIEGIIDGTAEACDEVEQQFLDDCRLSVAIPDALENQIMVANTYGSNCMILEQSYDDAERMEQAGFLRYGETEKYVVYFRKN